jgi:hypothetical protein
VPLSSQELAPSRPVGYARLLIALAFILTAANPSATRAQSAGRFVRWLGSDAASFVRVPSRGALTVASIEVASLGALSLLDRTVNHEVREGYSGFFADYVDVVNRIGNPESNYVTVGVFGISLLTGDTRFQDAAFTSLETFAFAGLFTEALKELVGRERPEADLGEYTFHPFSGNTSFPSGHATKAFAVLTPWVMYYPGPVTYGLLVIGASGTALARIAKDKHWMTDVLAGASIGFFTGRYLALKHQNADGGTRVHLTMAPNRLSLAVRF